MDLLKKMILCLICLPVITAYSQKTVVKYTDDFKNKNHPQILYWMWDDHTITNKQYLKDIDKIAAKSPFDLVILTSRFTDSIGFMNTKRMRPYLDETVKYAKRKGIKIGLQLWPLNRTRELFINDYPVSTKDAEALIAESECVLDENGKGAVHNKPLTARSNKIIHSGLLKIWLFKKISNDFYEPSSLVEADNNWLKQTINNDMSMDIQINAPKKYYGYSAYVTTEHYYNFFDVLSDKHSNFLKKMLDDYSGIPFAGTALDENGNMGIATGKIKKGEIMTDRTWSDQFASYYAKTYDTDPVRLLFDMRYAPENKDDIKIKAINTYFDSRTKGPLKVENAFCDCSKQLFGNDIFSGCHATFHNALTNDDVWTTGIDWWDLPRDYGQTDEAFPMPDKMGIGMSGTKPVMYDMYYSRNKEQFFKEALNNAAYGVRIHYHAWNDRQGWGRNIYDDDFLEDLEPVEKRIRLLNIFNPAPPSIPILVVYNFPYLYNWYPDIKDANVMGIRQTDMQRVASSIWNAGYPCASIPSTWLERDIVKVKDDGKIQIKDRLFDAVIFLNPQYAKECSFGFMKEVLAKKGRLMIQGKAYRDFNGKDCTDMFAEISKRAFDFDLNSIEKMGIEKNAVVNGIFLQDGSAVMSNYESVKNKENTKFEIKIGKDLYTGSYQGIMAIKTNSDGNVEKMACGNFQSLTKNGKIILELEKKADIMILRKDKKLLITIKGNNNKIITNMLH